MKQLTNNIKGLEQIIYIDNMYKTASAEII